LELFARNFPKFGTSCGQTSKAWNFSFQNFQSLELLRPEISNAWNFVSKNFQSLELFVCNSQTRPMRIGAALALPLQNFLGLEILVSRASSRPLQRDKPENFSSAGFHMLPAGRQVLVAAALPRSPRDLL